MSEREELVLSLLRGMRGDLADIKADMRDVKQRMMALEIQTAQQVSAEASHYASLALRLDGIDGRLERIEHRTGIPDAPA